MDARHESFKQEFINQLLTVINHFLVENTDSLVTDPEQLQDIEKLCEPIYRYVGINVDIHNILSKHNLLSIDVVLFPHLNDPEANMILSEHGFDVLIDQIKLSLKLNPTLELKDQIKRILDKHHL